jgi:hypothetical protein
MSRSRLIIVASVSLLATALLGLAVSRGFSAFRLERHVHNALWRPWPGLSRWSRLADLLAVPAILIVLVASAVFGHLKGVLWRVGVLATFALAAVLINDEIIKPTAHERFFGELSFPSGNVTAACATGLAMWFALYPVLGRVTRMVSFAFVVVWTALMSFAVVAAFWHTPLDCVGSVLLSTGVVTAGAALLAPKQHRAPPDDEPSDETTSDEASPDDGSSDEALSDEARSDEAPPADAPPARTLGKV